jgi:hypothetical protein
MAAHIGRIIVPFQDRGSTANFSRASKFPQQSQNDESGTAYRATESSERRRMARQKGRGIIVRSTWRQFCLKPDRSRRFKFFIEKSGNSESDASDQIKRPDNRRPYLLAPRYVVHTALANVWDAFRAHAFSTSATIDDILILGCVWPLAAAT